MGPTSASPEFADLSPAGYSPAVASTQHQVGHDASATPRSTTSVRSFARLGKARTGDLMYVKGGMRARYPAATSPLRSGCLRPLAPDTGPRGLRAFRRVGTSPSRQPKVSHTFSKVPVWDRIVAVPSALLTNTPWPWSRNQFQSCRLRAVLRKREEPRRERSACSSRRRGTQAPRTGDVANDRCAVLRVGETDHEAALRDGPDRIAVRIGERDAVFPVDEDVGDIRKSGQTFLNTILSGKGMNSLVGAFATADVADINVITTATAQSMATRRMFPSPISPGCWAYALLTVPTGRYPRHPAGDGEELRCRGG